MSLRRFIGYSLILAGVLINTFFRGYNGHYIQTPIFYLALGTIFFISGLLILKLTASKKEIDMTMVIETKIKELKSIGENITVNLLDCDILEYENSQEDASFFKNKQQLLELDIERKIQALNSLKENTIDTTIKKTIIVFTYSNIKLGITEKFISRSIPKDKATLQYNIIKDNETTTLYVMKNNRHEYYFDLDFLFYSNS